MEINTQTKEFKLVGDMVFTTNLVREIHNDEVISEKFIYQRLDNRLHVIKTRRRYTTYKSLKGYESAKKRWKKFCS